MDTVRLPQLGGCVCGRVRYRLNAAPLLAYACHCHDCQKRSGSAFGLTVVVRTADVAMDGALEVVVLPTPSGRNVEQHLCATCRCRIYAQAAEARDFLSLRAGSLDQTDWIVPVVQTWTQSALPWALIPGVRHLPQEEFDFVALGREWQGQAPKFVEG